MFSENDRMEESCMNLSQGFWELILDIVKKAMIWKMKKCFSFFLLFSEAYHRKENRKSRWKYKLKHFCKIFSLPLNDSGNIQTDIF